MRRLLFAGAISGALLVALVGGGLAVATNGKGSADARAFLDGYQETPSISTVAKGELRAKINKANSTITYTLRYTGIEGGAVSAAHIHFGQRHVAGGVSAFLCGGGDKPPCPSPGGTVSGTIDAADVIGPAGQGIAAGQIDELIRAMRVGATYANVHSATYPAGEIRGQIRAGGRKGGD